MNVREDDSDQNLNHDFVCGLPDFHKTKVVPGNIIDTNTMALHRFGSLIYIETDDSTLTRRKMYSLMKNSITLTVCKIKV
jgi:sugar lactone lactonase YvrE